MKSNDTTILVTYIIVWNFKTILVRLKFATHLEIWGISRLHNEHLNN